MGLKESIRKSEGRVICGQHLLFAGPGLVRGVTNSELMFAFGADMVMLNTINLDDPANNPGLCGMSYQQLKALCRRPIGVYLGCPGAGIEAEKTYSLDGMLATPEHVATCIEWGVDCIDLPALGTRSGITVEGIRELVTFVHSYKPGTLAMCFLDSSVECADEATVREVTLMMKQTGADILCIGDGGFSGGSRPENVHAMSVAAKGMHYTYFRMASVNR